LAEETGGSLIADASRTCSNRGSRKNKHSNGMLKSIDSVCILIPIYHGYKKRNRNCYSYEEFRYLARNCRNRGMRDKIGERRRLEYRRNEQMTKNNRLSNLNGNKNLIVLN